MTTRTTTVEQTKQGFRGVLVMTAATVALLGGVVLFQLRPTSDTAAPTTATGSTASGLEDHLLQERYPQAEAAVPAVSEAAQPRGGMAELYAELQAGAGTRSVAPVAVASMADMEDATTVVPVAVDTMGGMAELYREQRAAADQDRTRLACGDGVQPATCY